LLASHGITPRTRLALKAIFSANPVTQRSFLALAAMWRPLGVDVQLVGLETRAYSMQLRAGDYDLQDYVPFATIHTPGTFVSRFASDSFLNFMYYRSAEVDQLIASAERQLDPAARIRMYRQVEAKLLVDQPIIPLYSAVAHRLVAGRVRGWVDHSALASPSRFLSVMD
jgi:oligopeptide transport system substrate-binding protein